MPGKYDIFISYRHQGGDITARILCERFTTLGYNVFFDVEKLRAGDFNTELYDVIDQCNDFLIILSPDALDRCENEGDWVRNELSYELKKKKNIVPVLLRGFTFPDKLPEDIKDVRFKYGMEASSEFFDAFVAKLQKFLTSKPLLHKRIKQSALIRKTMLYLIILACLFTMTIIAYVVNGIYRSELVSYKQEDEDSILDSMSSYYALVQEYERQLSFQQLAVTKTMEYKKSNDQIAYDEAIAAIDSALKSISDSKQSNEETFNKLAETSSTNLIDADLKKLITKLKNYQKSAEINLQDMKDSIGRYDNFCPNEIENIANENQKDINVVKDELHAAYERSRQKFKPEASDSEGILWGKMLRFLTLKMPEDAKSCIDMYYGKVKEADPYAAAYVPVVKQFIDSMPKTGIDYGVIIIGYEPGVTSHPIYEIGDIIVAVNGERCLNADSLIARTMNNGDMVTVLKFDGQRPFFITKVYEKTGKKVGFMSLTERADEESTKPFLGLDPEALWDRAGKSMSDFQLAQAADCLQIYHMLVRGKDTEADTYVPALLRFYDGIDSTGINYGAIVTAVRADKTNGDQLLVGDVIVSVNGVPCENADAFLSASIQMGSKINPIIMNEVNKVTVLRANDGEVLKEVDLNIESRPYIVVKSVGKNWLDIDALFQH